MVKLEDVPEELRLNYFLGEIVIGDSFAEHEARVLGRVLHEAGLTEGAWPQMFGRLLPKLRDALDMPNVPAEFRQIAIELIETTQRWHRYRRDLVHDLLVVGWGPGDDVYSALRKHPPRPMRELAECATALRICGYRLRGLYIIAPYWLGVPSDGWDDAAGLQSWTRVAMGYVADVPGSIMGTEGPAPEPPGGWMKIVADAEVRRNESG